MILKIINIYLPMITQHGQRCEIRRLSFMNTKTPPPKKKNKKPKNKKQKHKKPNKKPKHTQKQKPKNNYLNKITLVTKTNCLQAINNLNRFLKNCFFN